MESKSLIDGDMQGDCGRPLSHTWGFSEDRRCSRLPTDTTVKIEIAESTVGFFRG